MRNIKITRMQTADKSLQQRITLDRILACVDQTDTVVHVIAQRMSFFNAHHAAGLGLERTRNGVDQQLGFSGTLGAHHNINHRAFLLLHSPQPKAQRLIWLVSFYQVLPGKTSAEPVKLRKLFLNSRPHPPSSCFASARLAPAQAPSNGSTPHAHALIAPASSKK